MSIAEEDTSKPASKPATTTGETTMEARGTGLVSTVTSLFESIGVLNKGSSDSAATPKADDAAQTAGISSNALNVTRVGGLTALIASAGAAALAIFNVHKGTDPNSVVVAAYASVGAIVAAGLLTAAIIIGADIRARSATNPTSSPSATPPPSTAAQPTAKVVAPAPSGTTVDPGAAKPATTDASTFGDAWYRALSMLHDALARLEHTPVTPDQGWVDGVTAAWLHAVASNGKTQNLKPAEAQSALHAQLSAGQTSVESLLQKLVNDDDPTDAKKADTIMRITSVFNLMDQSLPWPN